MPDSTATNAASYTTRWDTILSFDKRTHVLRRDQL